MAGAMLKFTKTCLSKTFPQTPSVYFPLSTTFNYSQQQGGSGESTIDPDEELGALTQKSKENLEEMLQTIEDKGQDKTKNVAGTEADEAEKVAEGVKAKAATAEQDKDDDEKGEQGIGEKARQTAEEMWVVAKDAKDKIKESVVGKSKNDAVKDDVPAEKRVCENVVDSARKVGNFDHEKK